MVKKEAEKKETNITTESESKSFQLNQFVDDTKGELKKVVWPGRQQLISESAAVILMVSLVATIVYLVDQFFAWGAGKIFQ
ncbi:preprotein translocase subunit SecE [Aphanothece hegewaldii CCALA 016]|uniref:Protein translocase subunit SecE n=1 Tax=Aphanothece hegewaldii CCALA 016 TaxID=2107694 RepID=A0A2T1LRC6_9CHRO|nr:preprotein translocase subunit SecE [Aphanothece hegewaldii]PSF31172.1 preprotein translocase subunit SecE [Aphanothece hegewaldii CCALA 016]